MHTLSRILRSLPVLLAVACATERSATAPPLDDLPVDLSTLTIPQGFDFRMQRPVSVTLLFPPTHPARASGRFSISTPDSPVGPGDVLLEGRLTEASEYLFDLPVATTFSSLLLAYETASGVATETLVILDDQIRFSGAVTGLIGAPARGGALRDDDDDDDEDDDDDDEDDDDDDDDDEDDDDDDQDDDRDRGYRPGMDLRFVTYSPSRSGWGSIAFEDNWPSKGDYDFNDLVISYRVAEHRDRWTRVVALDLTFRVEAIGASFANGFGVELPISPDLVSRVVGGLSSRNAADGPEPGSDRAVVIVFDDVGAALPGSGIRNTRPNGGFISGDEHTVRVELSRPTWGWQLGSAPYNPFIFVDQDRSREVHLVGQRPTGHARGGFNSADDAGGYRTRTGLPWAILVPHGWTWPAEKQPVNRGHLEFATWAESGGSSHADWYIDKGDNRRARYLFLR